MSFQYCPMLDYPQNPIVYDDNLLSSIIPANMMIKQEQMAADDLLLTSGYYPHMQQEVPTLGYPSDGYSHQCNNMNDLTYLAATTVTTAIPAAAATATAGNACSSSPSTHCSYDSFYSPAESMTSFDFFPSTAYNDQSLFEYWSNNSSPAPVSQHFDALYFDQPANVLTMPAINTFSSSSSSSTSSTSSSPSTQSASLTTQITATTTNTNTASPKSQIEGRPYPCPSCPRAFARKHDLQRHIRVHTGDKPYMCPCCKKTFARTDALKRHLRMEEQCRKSDQVQAMKDTGRRRYRNL